MTAVADASLASTWMRQLVHIHGTGARDVLEGFLVRLSPMELAALNYHWRIWARSKQWFPEDGWRVLLILAGRSWGKTRAINEWILNETIAGRVARGMLIGRTDAEAKRVFVDHQKSGLRVIAPPWFKPRVYVGELPRVVWPNGAILYLVGAEAPDTVRGDDLDVVVWDEVAAADPTKAGEVFYNARMALRGRERARLVMATTSKKRKPIMRKIRDLALSDPDRYRIIYGSTLENTLLPRDFVEDLVKEYAGTELWQQELEGRILDDEDDEDALWRAAWFRRVPRAPELARRVVAVDPAVSVRAGSDETGIVGAGATDRGDVYVLADRSGRLSADAWPRAAWQLAYEIRADVIVVETNRGGNLVTRALMEEREVQAKKPGQHDLVNIGVKEVRAEHQKETRADPVSRFYERGRVFHVGDELQPLEDQQLTWDPRKRKSPDRIDALVWAVWELVGRGFVVEEQGPAPTAPHPHDFYDAASSYEMDPYAAIEAVQGRR